MRSQIALINMHLQSYFIFKSVKTTQKWKKNSCLGMHIMPHCTEWRQIFFHSQTAFILNRNGLTPAAQLL